VVANALSREVGWRSLLVLIADEHGLRPNGS
jgi:hypothetical protein